MKDEALLERLNDLTPAEYVKLAYYALDQADVSVTSFAEANRQARGKLDTLLENLGLEVAS